MSDPAISVLIYTARVDHPYPLRPDLHCFDPVTQTLAAQSFHDFELIVADALWEDRGDWFAVHPQPYPVKHVPSTPNYWHERGRPGVCAQINRGIAWADGALIWMGAENNLFPSHFLDLVWSLFGRGLIPVAWYGVCDKDTADAPEHESPRYQHPPLEFNLLDYTPDMIHNVDHRAQRFVDDRALVLSPCHHQNYFAYAALPTDLALALNGFDELFDGDLGLLDTDMGSRIDLAGASSALTMHRDLWLVEPWAPSGRWGGTIKRHLGLKCPYAVYLCNRATGRRVNTPLPHDFIEEVKRVACYRDCLVKDKCASGVAPEKIMYPFCEGENRALAREAFAALRPHELLNDVQLRGRRRPPFDRAYVHGARR